MEQEKVKKPFGRSLSDFGDRSQAEQRLLDACRAGRAAVLGSKVPELATISNRVRADFLRFLVLGGDEHAPVHELGVYLQGAFVEGQLNLNGCHIKVNVNLPNCYFISALSMENAKLDGMLSLEGSHLVHGLNAGMLRCASDVMFTRGFRTLSTVSLLGAKIDGSLCFRGGLFEVLQGDAISADNVNVIGNIFLDEGFKATAMVNLLGAHIGGNLDCSGGQFKVEEGVALIADGAIVKGNINLCVYEDPFEAVGEVRLMGVVIDGDLNCCGGSFKSNNHALSADRIQVKGSIFFKDGFAADGVVRLLNAQIDGDLDCTGGLFVVNDGVALRLDAAVVRGSWILTKLSKPACTTASHADVAVLVDDLDAWALGSRFDGFRYGTFGGHAPTNGKDRIAWLDKQPELHLTSEDFRPQPWRQLQRVLREMGHAEDAKQVGIAYEKHQRKIGRVGLSSKGENCIIAWWRRVTTQTVHDVFGVLAGYGYRPMRLVTYMLGVWLGCAILYGVFAQQPFNAIAPSDPLVFQNTSYAQCRSNELHTVQAAKVAGQGNWPSCSLMSGEYSTFSSFAYSLDLLLPVVDLGQETAWGAYIPAANEGESRIPILNLPWGYAVRWITWFEILFGWISSLILVATISGFSRRNDES